MTVTEKLNGYGPLAGIKVVEMCTYVAAPATVRVLSEIDVYKRQEQHDGVREAHQQKGAAHEGGGGGQKDADVHGLQQLARKRRGDGHGQVHNGDVHGERGDLNAQALSHDRLEQAPGGEA